MKKKIIPIFFTIDDGYAKYLAVAVKSLIENANKEHNYKIHVIYEDLTEENKENTFNGSFKAHLKSCCMDSCFGGSVESF